MKSYGQFCSVARALDLLGERWTLLVVRELLCGSRRFSEIRCGIPLISRTMLSARLRELLDGGLIEQEDDGYRLTDAGRELEGIVAALGTWGQRWLSRDISEDELDVDALVWDMRRRVNVQALPKKPVVVRIELTDVRERRFLLLKKSEVSLCHANPGFPEELCLRIDRRILIAWWRGDIPFPRGTLTGRKEHARAFPSWFERYLFAEVRPAVP
jgi:DNA-binding HxlR family transcriptional regulator